MKTVRVVAREGIAEFVARDGVEAAQQHGRKEPEPGGSGDRIETYVTVPGGGFETRGGEEPGLLLVQGVHWRSDGWAYRAHRVLAGTGEPDSDTYAAGSPWAPGAWPGDSVLSDAFDPKLPPEAAA